MQRKNYDRHNNTTIGPCNGLLGAIELPDKVRESISFQLESLGVLHWSLDGGITSYKAVGTGERLTGNFSKRTIYFKVDSGTDNVQIMVQHTLLKLHFRLKKIKLQEQVMQLTLYLMKEQLSQQVISQKQ